MARRTVGGQPGADEGSVDDLEAKRGEPYDDVHGCHAGLQEWEGDSAVGVVDDEEAGENFVLPGEVAKSEAALGGKGAHHVEKGHEAGRFHGEPANPAGQVEAAGD